MWLTHWINFIVMGPHLLYIVILSPVMCSWMLIWLPMLATLDSPRLLLTEAQLSNSRRARWDLEGLLAMLPQVSLIFSLFTCLWLSVIFLYRSLFHYQIKHDYSGDLQKVLNFVHLCYASHFFTVVTGLLHISRYLILSKHLMQHSMVLEMLYQQMEASTVWYSCVRNGNW